MRGRFFLVALAATFALALSGCEPSRRGPRGPGKAPEGSVSINIALVNDSFVLPNGLLVLFHREPASPSVLVHVRYHVGSKDDPPGRSGFAHLFEHLMFLGSRNTGDKDHSQWLEEVGGAMNAETSRDHTGYHEEVPPSALPLALWLESDRMAYPLAKLDDDAFARERDVVKNEWREHYEDVPYGHVDNIAREAVFGRNHPYGSPNIGRPEELDRSTLAEARAFAGKYYRPNNATLVVCGAFDMAAARKLVTQYFATIPAGPALESRTVDAPALEKNRRIDVEAGVEAPAVTLAWPVPAVHGDGLAELEYGFSFFAARARHRLVTEKKIANAVEAHIEPARLGGLATVTVRLKPGGSTDTAISVLDEYLTEATRIGRLYPWDNFGDYKTRAMVHAVSALETLEGRAAQMLHGVEYHGEQKDSAQLDLQTKQNVRSDEVGPAVEQFLADAPRVTVVVSPNPGAPRSGRRK